MQTPRPAGISESDVLVATSKLKVVRGFPKAFKEIHKGYICREKVTGRDLHIRPLGRPFFALVLVYSMKAFST